MVPEYFLLRHKRTTLTFSFSLLIYLQLGQETAKFQFRFASQADTFLLYFHTEKNLGLLAILARYFWEYYGRPVNRDTRQNQQAG